MKLSTMSDIATAVRNARTGQALTQGQLAQRLGVSRDWVIRLEKGNPRLEVQRVLAALAALGIRIEGVPVPPEEDPFADVFGRLS